MVQFSEVDAGYRKAMRCRSCFDGDLKISSGHIHIAQPRWVGEQYFSASRRILFVLINPGSGTSNRDDYNKEAEHKMLEYRDGYADLVDVLIHQREHMHDWGRKRFLRYYINSLGLDLDYVAFLNMALCSTNNNPRL